MGTVSCSSSQMDILPGSPQVPHTCSGFSGFPFHLDAFLSTTQLWPTTWGLLHHTPLLNSSFIYSLIQRPCLEHLPPSGSVPGTGDILVMKTHMGSDLIELSFLGKTDTKQIYKYMYNYHVYCVNWRKRTGCSERRMKSGEAASLSGPADPDPFLIETLKALLSEPLTQKCLWNPFRCQALGNNNTKYHWLSNYHMPGTVRVCTCYTLPFNA